MKMTNAFTTFMLLTTLCFSSLVKSDEVVIPLIAKPSVLQEGTQRELTAGQIAELLPWAKNSKVFLNDLLNTVAGLSSADKLDRLEDGIKSIVGESAPKNTELLMRYVLNRGLVINDLLKTEMNADEVGTIDTKLRVLTLSIKMAIVYYDTDMNTLNKKTNAPFITFGVQYFEFLTELNKSIFDASASYNIQRTAFEWLQWDLYRDLNNQQVASQIVKINNSLKIYPVKKMSDTQYISYIRQMKLMAQQLDLNTPQREHKSQVEDDNFMYKNEINFSDAEYIEACASSFAYNTKKSECFSLAKKNKIDPGMIKVCGASLNEDEQRFNCIQLLNGVAADSYNIKSYQACSDNFAYNSNKVACMSVVNQSKPDVADIAACGRNLNEDSVRMDCLKIVASNANRGVRKLENIIATCGNSFAYNSRKIECLPIAINNNTKLEDIRECSRNLNEDDKRKECITIIGSQKLDSSTKIIRACGDNFAYNSYKASCIEIGFEKNLNPSSIAACGKMGTDPDRFSCLKTL